MKMILASSVLVILASGIILGSEMKVHARAHGGALRAGVRRGGRAGLVRGPAGLRRILPPRCSARRQRRRSGQQRDRHGGRQRGGPKIFADNCSSCHPNGGNVVVRKPAAEKGRRSWRSQATFIASSGARRCPTAPRGACRASRADQISDKQAGELFSYVTSMLPSWK